MIYHAKIMLYVCAVFFIALLLSSCGSTVGPEGVLGSADEGILFIRYYDQVSEICSIKPDGSDLQIIASYDGSGQGIYEGYFGAKWSPDKSRIVISGGPRLSNEIRPLWLMDNEGDLLRRLTEDGGAPSWSSDGNEILFSRRTSYFSFLLDYYIINVQTRSIRKALNADPPYWWSGADWSSDGRYILTNEEYPYANEDGEGDYSDREIIQLRLHSGEKIQLTDNDVQDGGADWSPDESKIVYISGNYTTGTQIKLMNSDGSGKEILVDSLALYNTVCWSPDGAKIAYNKSEMEGYAKYEEGSDIYVLDIGSGTVNQVTNSADESIIVYVQDWK